MRRVVWIAARGQRARSAPGWENGGRGWPRGAGVW